MADERVRVVVGQAPGTWFTVDGELLIGRAASDVDGRLGDDPQLSRSHARMARGAGGVLTIEDLGSSNGTFVNGERVEGVRVLRLGDVVRLGTTELAVTDERGLVPEATRTDAPAPAPVAVPEGLIVGDGVAMAAPLPSSGGRLLLAGTVGALVAVSLGIYGNVHDPASDLSITLGFTDTLTMKVWLATLAVLFAVVQLGSALWMYGRVPLGAAPGVAGLAASDLGPGRVPAHAAGRLPVPVPADVRGHVDPSPAALAAGLRVLRSVRREDRRGPLARAAGDGASAGGRRAVHAAGRCVADERLVVHLGQRLPVALVVLARIDHILAPLTWLAAAFAVLVLFVGPKLIGAETEGGAAAGAPTGAAATPSGKEVFVSAGCGGCHTFRAAGSSGVGGPDLDEAKPSADAAEAIVTSGSGSMPSFKGRLSAAEITAVAEFISGTEPKAAAAAPSGRQPSVAATIPVGRGPDGITVAGSDVWVTDAGGTLMRIDAGSDRRAGAPSPRGASRTTRW